MTQHPRAVEGSCILYRTLLRGYPSSFRLDCEDEMAMVFRDMAITAWSRGGYVGLAMLWPRVLADFAKTIAQQHWRACRESGPRTNAFGFAVLAGLLLILAGWLVDSFSLGGPDHHWLDGIGLSLLVVLALLGAMTPGRDHDGEMPGRVVTLTPNRRAVLAATVLAITSSGVVYTFVADTITVNNQRQPLVQSPLREFAGVVTLTVVFALTQSALKHIQRIPPARRRQTMLTLAGWALAVIFAAMVAACVAVYLLISNQVLVHPDLILTLGFVAALLATLTIAHTILYLDNRWAGDRGVTPS